MGNVHHRFEGRGEACLSESQSMLPNLPRIDFQETTHLELHRDPGNRTAIEQMWAALGELGPTIRVNLAPVSVSPRDVAQRRVLGNDVSQTFPARFCSKLAHPQRVWASFWARFCSKPAHPQRIWAPFWARFCTKPAYVQGT